MPTECDQIVNSRKIPPLWNKRSKTSDQCWLLDAIKRKMGSKIWKDKDIWQQITNPYCTFKKMPNNKSHIVNRICKWYIWCIDLWRMNMWWVIKRSRNLFIMLKSFSSMRSSTRTRCKLNNTRCILVKIARSYLSPYIYKKGYLDPVFRWFMIRDSPRLCRRLIYVYMFYFHMKNSCL